ncbi:hypothetical protein ABEH32_07400 [Pantoea agglomerans]|uniref:hypothetical protein n=1 Tax=Enterobacter agglomerans TaxID=549 RepID=UPI001653EECF|nr:hypothetical protein [Pantoea agglomerans]
MEILFRLSGQWPKEDNNLAFKMQADADGVIRKRKTFYLLHDDGRIYKSFSGLPFIYDIEEFQIFKLININEEMFILQRMEEWPEGTSKDNGITSKLPVSAESVACWYMHHDGSTMPTYFDAPAIEMHRKINKNMPVVTYEVLS